MVFGGDAIKEAPFQGWKIAGTATAGIPHGAIIADKMNCLCLHPAANQKITELVTKSKVAAQGQRLVVVEDLISTGGSVLEAP